MLNEKEEKHISKLLSLVLRHEPAALGLTFDNEGWVEIDILLPALINKGHSINFQQLEALVKNNNKQRFAFNAENTKIRANQGHSVDVDLGLQAKTPPSILLHGTGEKYVSAILKEGINKQNRNHVHLSSDIETAHKVGQRHGKPFIFKVLAGEMVKQGMIFYHSENGVWLTDYVGVEFLKGYAD